MAGIPQSVSQGWALKSFDAVAKLTCTADVASDNVTSSVFKKVTTQGVRVAFSERFSLAEKTGFYPIKYRGLGCRKYS